MKKYIVIVLSILLLTGCDINFTSKKVKEELVEGAYLNITKEIEVFSEPHLKDIIDTNIEIKGDYVLDTETIGENSMAIEYTYNGKKTNYLLKYDVVDNVKPIYISANQYVTLLVHDDANPCDSINIADNYSKIPTCNIVGDYNIEKVGTYNVKYVISDEAGNTNEKDLTLNYVKELPEKKKNPSTPSTSYVDFEWVKNKYKNDSTEIGLDVSRWQGDIDYEQVKEAGATFVMMRIGVSNDIDEDLAMDSKFKQNIKNAKAAGLKVGVYVYTTAINDDMAKTAANFVIDCLDGETLDFPIVFDWENWSKFRKYQISIHDLNNTFLTFDKELQKHNLSAMLYSSKYYLQIMWEDRLKDKYPVWLAHYNENGTDYTGKFKMWQLCSDGRIAGINGDVDIDVLYN
jgi:GH25 family lysozyme M1 (1,4-beta-N-acetylmuramidase)